MNNETTTPSTNPSSNTTMFIVLAIIAVAIGVAIWFYVTPMKNTAPAVSPAAVSAPSTSMGAAAVNADLANDLKNIPDTSATLDQNLDTVNQSIKGL